MGPSPYYGLYGIERVGALGDRQTLGRVDWFAKGRDFIQSTQACRRLVDGSPRDGDEHGLGDPVLDQVDGQDDPQDHDLARSWARARCSVVASCPKT